MKNGKRFGLCPLCGGKREPAMTVPRSVVTVEVGVVCNVPETLCDSCGAAWIDEKTAKFFEDVIAEARKKRL